MFRAAWARRQVPSAQEESFDMKARITLLTLGVDDLERAVGFYRDGLGVKVQ